MWKSEALPTYMHRRTVSFPTLSKRNRMHAVSQAKNDKARRRTNEGKRANNGKRRVAIKSKPIASHRIASHRIASHRTTSHHIHHIASHRIVCKFTHVRIHQHRIPSHRTYTCTHTSAVTARPPASRHASRLESPLTTS